MKNKIVFFILLFLLIFTLTTYSIDIKTDGDNFIFENIDYQKSSNIRAFLDEKQIQFDVNPQIINNRTLVPMRTIFEAIGLNVNWDNSTYTATGSNSENSIIFTIGSNKAVINNKEKNIDVPASIINGRTMVPLRFLSENMGYNVVWVGDSNLILISNKNIIEWRYGGYETIEPFKEYEIMFVNGEKMPQTRYNGKTHAVIVEWRFEGYESTSPHKEYERKYLNGVKTSETRYTGKTKPLEIKKPIALAFISAPCDSVGGRDVDLYWRNNSGKTIKYITFNVTPYNAVGDVEYCAINGSSTVNLKVTGPIETTGIESWIVAYDSGFGGRIPELVSDKDESEPWYVGNNRAHHYLTEQEKVNTVFGSYFSKVWYNGNIDGVAINKIYIEYMDGTTESLSNSQIKNLWI